MTAVQRIVCMLAELPELLDRLGALDRVVGISVYTARPEAALKLPKVTGFRTANLAQLRRLDLAVLGFDVQKELALKLAEAGIPVLHLHPHRLQDLFRTIDIMGGLLDKRKEAASLAAELQAGLDAVRQAAAKLPRRPRVYFEEWMDPLICGTGWVSDAIDIAGGVDVFRERAVHGRKARDRVVTPEEIIAAAPELIVASWCGKPFDRAQLEARSGFDRLPAVRNGAVIEMDGTMLQCGPALVDRIRELHERIRELV
jgi:iron complex transport system substrate-binding protein